MGSKCNLIIRNRSSLDQYLFLSVAKDVGFVYWLCIDKPVHFYCSSVL